MRLKEIRLIVIVTAMLCMFAQPALANSAISVEPAYIGVWQGEEFTVNIKVDPAENEVYSASYTLHFDNTLLKAISWTQGEFLTRDGKSSNLWKHEINNTLGKFEYAEGRMGTGIGVGGDPGNLTTITFQAIGNGGVSLLELGAVAGGLLESTSGPIPTDLSNGMCKIIEQTPTSTPTTPPTTTVTTTPVQTPTPTATAVQTLTIHSTPSPPPTTTASPISSTVPTSPPKEKSEENNRLPGFRAAFAITGLLAVFILKRKNVIK